MLQIVIERSFDWTIAIAAGAALGGALVGAASVFFVEFWRQLLAARSAARIIRMEIQANMNTCIQAVVAREPVDQISDRAWTTNSITLAPLLPEEALFKLATNYGALFVARNWIRRIPEDYDGAREQVVQWLENASVDPPLLIQIEKRKRLAQFGDLLFGRATFPPPVQGGHPGGPSEAPEFESILQQIEHFAKAEQGGQKEGPKE